MKSALCLLTFLLGILSVFGKRSYAGEQVLSVTVKDQKQLDMLQYFAEHTGDLDVWTRDGILATGVNHIRMKNSTANLFAQKFETEIFIKDVQELIDNVEAEQQERMRNLKRPEAFFDDYRRYDEIVAELQTWARQFPDLVLYNPSIGQSIEGRDIPAITISGAGFKDPYIKRFFFQGGQHAREWIGPATVLYVCSKLLSSYGSDPDITDLLNNVEIVVVPLSNPDGYEYAHTEERLWRKNRRRNSGGTYGVDLNRNWNDHWGGSGSSKTPSSDTYCGTAAFSEPESWAASQIINSIDEYNNVLGAIDFHSYSQLVLRPYGWTEARCPDETALKIIGDGISYEIRQDSGYAYTSERSIDLYITTGTASDWYYLQGIWAAYTIELRDTGRYGFVLPPTQIIPTGEEIWASMQYFLKVVYDTHP